ncbi:hypothetical protein P8C59_003778 [Phyllachora maydis]|uniref:Peptidase A1 domain-containing protein n=1 Tax=Phyllachora maydis TaxID=1825666 RepID=A0AAD9I233_9PEZI|nr:hypothetical protein P8C59_003778 [Phyllachora maydis]
MPQPRKLVFTVASGLFLALAVAAERVKNSPVFSRSEISIAEAPPSHILSLSHNPRRNVLGSPARARIAHKLQQGQGPAPAVGTEAINTLFSGVYPVVNVTWGNRGPSPAGGGGNTTDGDGQQFISFVDTGSSDTWVATSALQCVTMDQARAPLPQAACAFGPLYNVSLGSFQNITSAALSISYYPEEEVLHGSVVTAPITVAGITVPRQEAGLVDYAAWTGDGVSSGLLGLGYPSLTSATNRAGGAASSRGPYDPWFTSAAKQGLVRDAVFTLALDRVPQGQPNNATNVHAAAGLLAVGGLVPAAWYVAPFTSVPIEPTRPDRSGAPLSWYTTTHTFVYGPAGGAGARTTVGPYQSIVDTGTAANFVPTAAAAAVNAAFSPPARFNASLGYWTADCDATAPYAAFVIGGVEMPMDPRDMIFRGLNGLPGYENLCFSVFADGGDANEDAMIIGEVWQLSYVVAYDQGRSMMHFAKRSSQR